MGIVTPAERVDALLERFKLSVNTYSREMLREELLAILYEHSTIEAIKHYYGSYGPCGWAGQPPGSDQTCGLPSTAFIHACPLCPEHAAAMGELDRLREAAQDRRGIVGPAHSEDFRQTGCPACESRQEDHFLIVKPPTP